MEGNEMHTDLTFFTNEKDSTLLKRFQVTLENNTQFFDVLVGYFRTSGFFHLYKSLEKVEKIRILVGGALKALEEGVLPKQTTKTLVKEIKKENNPLKIIFKFKQGIPQNFFSEGFVDNPYYNTAPREVILSEYLIGK